VGVLEDATGLFHSWREPLAQEWLAGHVENLKFEPGFNVVCDCEAPEEHIRALWRMVLGEHQGSPREWFEALAERVHSLGWSYVPLPEITRFDLLVLGEVSSGISLLPSCKEAQASWKEDRAFWPAELE
jgi:hypothetical protein